MLDAVVCSSCKHEQLLYLLIQTIYLRILRLQCYLPGIADIGVMAGRENVKCVLAQPRDLEHASSQDIEVVGAQSWALEAINLNWILSYS